MRKASKLGIALLSTAAVFVATAAAATAHPPAANSPGGATKSGVYPNLFLSAGYSQAAINTRLRATWNQLFKGAPGTDANRYDGQTIMYSLDPTMEYVEDIGNQDVRTEGMGYAMMIAVQLNHRSDFNKLWKFAKTKMQITSGPEKYYFAWHTDTTGKVLSTGVAPDGDQWMAEALLSADGRWGSAASGINDYELQGQRIIHAMWHAQDTAGGVNMFSTSTYLPTFSPPGAVTYTDPSYCLPGFYKNFAKADPTDKDLWGKAYTAAQTLLQKAADPTTGLAPDYANFDGTPHLSRFDTPTDDNYDHNFQEDAWRAIANANINAEWDGVQGWQTQYSNTLENFFEGQGVQTYVSRYHLDGTPLTSGQNTYEPAHAQGLLAMNAASAISATNKDSVDFVRDLWNTAIPSGQARYYDGMLYTLGLLYVSGNFRIWAAH